MSTTTSRKYRNAVFLSILAITICITLGTYAAWRIMDSPMHGIDDANIFFVYAKHFASGHGIVYNVGGEHVEGYSSVAYFLLCSLAFLLFPVPETALFWMNFLFTIITSALLLYVLNQIADHLGFRRGGKLLLLGAYLLWLAINPVYFAWTVTLMDLDLYSLILTASYARVASLVLRETPVGRREAIQVGILCGLCILVRPEGIGWALTQAFVFACICWAQTRSLRQALQLTAVPISILALTLAALLGFREVYFGYPLPNTFYAKVSSSLLTTLRDGRFQLHLFLWLYGTVFILPLATATCWILYTLARRRPTGRLFWFSTITAFFSIVGLLMPVMEGGDNFAGCRMFECLYPLLGITLLLPLLLTSKARNLSFDAVYLFCLGVVIAFTTHVTWPTFRLTNGPGVSRLAVLDQKRRLGMNGLFTQADDGRITGARLERIFAGEHPTIGIVAAGGIPINYHGTVYDMVGLNLTSMAHADKIKSGPKGHASFNEGVFYNLAPDILLPWAAPSGITVNLEARKADLQSPLNFDNAVFHGIFSQQPFKSLYVLAVVRNPSDPDDVAYGCFRKTYLEELATKRGFAVVSTVAF